MGAPTHTYIHPHTHTHAYIHTYTNTYIQAYYYNKHTDYTQWEHPLDEYHRSLFSKLKLEISKGNLHANQRAKQKAMKDREEAESIAKAKAAAEEKKYQQFVQQQSKC
jgi:hypothetical protein